MFGHWHLETNLLSILPKTANNQQFSAAEDALFNTRNQQAVVLISGDNALAAYNAINKEVEQLANVDVIAQPEMQLSDIVEFYRPFRNNFVSSSYQNAISSAAELTQYNLNQLVQLTNPLVSETLQIAPRLNLADYLANELPSLSPFKLEQGIATLAYENKTFLVMRLQFVVDGFSLAQSKQLSTSLLALFTQIRAEQTVEVHVSGILFHTAESMAQAEQEISSFGLLSLLVVVLLVLFVFKSIKPLFGALAVIAIASIYGLTALLFFFEKLHLLTVIFAITLIGIVIDYCFHVFIYQYKAVVKPLLLGFITTALGYIVLMLSPLDLLAQVAVFMVFGLLGALLTVLVLFPQLTWCKSLKISASAIRYSDKILSIMRRLNNVKVIVFPSLITLLVFFFVNSTWKFNDDVRLLNSSPAWLIEQEKRVAQVLGYQQAQRIIVIADSVEQLLQKQERVVEKLTTEQPNVVIKGLAPFLPSQALQLKNFNLIEQADVKGIFAQTYQLIGIEDPITSFAPLAYHQFLSGPFADLANAYMSRYQYSDDLQNNLQGYALWLEISGQSLSVETKQWISSQVFIQLHEPVANFTRVLTEYRTAIEWLLIAAFIVVAMVLLIRYGVKAGSVATIATISSALLALVTSQLVFGYLNIFNLLAVLLIIALAIDYVIFYQEKGLQRETLLAIMLSAISSAAVFGMLIFSVTPAVSSFGFTVMIGIVCIFILSPLTVQQPINTE